MKEGRSGIPVGLLDLLVTSSWWIASRRPRLNLAVSLFLSASFSSAYPLLK